MKHLPGRRAYLSVALKLSALLAAPALLWRTSSAQEIPLETGPTPAGDAAALAALRAEIADLRKTVERLDAEASTIKAPFTVYDPQTKKTILSVATGSAGQTKLTLTDASGATCLIGFQDAGALMQFAGAGGAVLAQLVGTPNNSQLVLRDDASHVVAGTSADGSQTGFFLERDGKQVAELIATAVGAELSMRDSAAKPVAKLSGAAAAPLSFLNAAGTSIMAVEIAGDFPILRIGDTKAAYLQAGVATTGDGAFVTLVDKSGTEQLVLSCLSGAKAITVSDTQGAEYFSVGQSGTRPEMVVGYPDKAFVVAGITEGGGGAYLSLMDNTGKDRINLSSDEANAPLAIVDAQSDNVFSVTNEAAAPALTLGKDTAARFQAGVLTDKSGAYFSLYDASNTERAFLTAADSSTYLSMNDSHMNADLGSDPEGDKAGLFLSKGSLNFASIRFDETNGGSVRLGDKGGDQIVGIGITDNGEGGGIGLNGSGRGKVTALLRATSGGGVVALLDKAAGKVRAQLSASATGDLNLYGEGGTFTASSGERSPVMQLADAGGTVVVENFINANGLGAVTVGPAGNGVAGTIGGGMQAASALIGKK